MRVEVLNTGSELLLGQVINSNVAFVGQRLAEVGLRIARQVTVPDGEDIRRGVDEALARGTELLFITGGLGPTSDDITRDVVAARFGRAMQFEEAIFEKIKTRFARRSLPMPELVRVQAMVPEGAEVLANDHGTAPGLYLAVQEGDRERHFFLLPGPPRELKPMWEAEVVPRLRRIRPDAAALHCLIFRTLGIGESMVQEKVEAQLREACPGIEVGYCARMGEVDLRLVHESRPETLETARLIVERELGDFIYAEGHQTLEETVIALATRQGKAIAVAESCTGGFLAHRLTNVPGSSKVFLGGAVTYSNAEKVRQLRVSEELLQQHGAVSEQVVMAMAVGIRNATGADLAVATSGIAGPGGGTEEKPVGLCCFGWATSKGAFSISKRLSQDREAFKYMAAQQALNLLRQELLEIRSQATSIPS